MERAQEVFEDAVRAEEAGHSAEALCLYEKASVIDPDASHARLRWASLLDLAHSSGFVLSADSRWRSSLSRRVFSVTSVPAAENRSRKSRSVPAFVSFFRQIRARPAKLEPVEAFHTKSRRARLWSR